MIDTKRTVDASPASGLRTYPGDAGEALFPLGGIGTGNISLGSRGELRDWEIFNLPAKGTQMPNTFFAIRVAPEGGDPVARVLESRLQPPHARSHGYHPLSGAGLPRLAESELIGTYPMARVVFRDDDLPVRVELEAFTPMIPLDPENSGIPAASLTYTVTNTGDRPAEVVIAGSLINPVGGLTYDKFGNLHYAMPCGRNVNAFRRDADVSGLRFSSEKWAPGDLNCGSLSLMTTAPQLTVKRAWLRGAWFDFLQEFWDDFASDGRLTDLGYEDPSADGKTDTGSLGIVETLQPGETKTFPFVLAWYFPNRLNGWHEGAKDTRPGRETIRNHYATRFADSWEAGAYLLNRMTDLRGRTEAFRDALFGSTLPPYVVDALAGNMPVLRSTTCFWLENGKFLGFEGTFDDAGSCEGSCTHVWNYEQTLAFLYPSLERSMRRIEFLEETDESGKMAFRAMRMFGWEWQWGGKAGPAAADGQLGSVMRLYREWKLSGDGAFLRELWPHAKRALDFALPHWDLDGDAVLDGEQHNTYDIEFYGPNPLTGFMLLGALKAGEAMAREAGDGEAADVYARTGAASAKRLGELTWNGEYFAQALADVDAHKYQHGAGCLSDQLLGQQLAYLYGLGALMEEDDRLKSAIRAVYRHNFRTDFQDHVNCQRVYALHDEQGLVLCSWPNGGRPKLPFVYSDEVWTGIEYHVATNLIYEGFVEEGLTIVKAVRDRHDGYRRSPWNEVECGHHYARSMSSWGLLIALTGFRFDMAAGVMSFAPVTEADEYAAFWSTGKGWGVYRQFIDPSGGRPAFSVDVLGGDMSGVTVHACGTSITL
ncbi:GH116 family glycosyl-hydrolase [Paenibacillus sp. GCM10023250]|uniref:GH116 family glycosyl-hydrolase n=1 Tax=Paenibacillus sp. GCM10023250 TaxID=3252648 RepID=UPI0036060966